MNLARKTSGSYCLLDHPFYLSQNHWNSWGSSPFPLKAVQQLNRYSLCAPLQAPARSRVCSATVFQKSHNKRSLVPIFKDTATFQVYMFIPPPWGILPEGRGDGARRGLPIYCGALPPTQWWSLAQPLAARAHGFVCGSPSTGRGKVLGIASPRGSPLPVTNGNWRVNTSLSLGRVFWKTFRLPVGWGQRHRAVTCSKPSLHWLRFLPLSNSLLFTRKHFLGPIPNEILPFKSTSGGNQPTKKNVMPYTLRITAVLWENTAFFSRPLLKALRHLCMENQTLFGRDLHSVGSLCSLSTMIAWLFTYDEFGRVED